VGVFTRPDSPVYWLYLETTKAKEKTAIRIGTTVAQQKDSAKLALDRYHQRMNELAARLYQLPTAVPAIRFATYAATYATDTIAHRRGAERELELLKPLVAFLGDDLVSAIDRDHVKSYMTARRQSVSARTVNREVDLLKVMIRDAVPKYLPIVKPKRRLLTEAEEARLLKHADATERALLLLGFDGLVRMKDALDVRREDRRGQWVYIQDPKSGEPYEIALSQRAAKALDAVPHEGTYYFECYRGARKARDRRARVRRALMALCKAARVPYGKAIGGITFHWATRRTGATRLVVTHKAPIPAVQRQGNWKSADVLLSIYAEADRKAQKAAIALPFRSRSRRKSA